MKDKEETKRAEEALRVLVPPDVFEQITAEALITEIEEGLKTCLELCNEQVAGMDSRKKIRLIQGVKEIEKITPEEMATINRVTAKIMKEFEALMDKVSKLNTMLYNVQELSEAGNSLSQAFKMVQGNGKDTEPPEGMSLFDFIGKLNKEYHDRGLN